MNFWFCILCFVFWVTYIEPSLLATKLHLPKSCHFGRLSMSQIHSISLRAVSWIYLFTNDRVRKICCKLIDTSPVRYEFSFKHKKGSEADLIHQHYKPLWIVTALNFSGTAYLNLKCQNFLRVTLTVSSSIQISSTYLFFTDISTTLKWCLLQLQLSHTMSIRCRDYHISVLLTSPNYIACKI